MSLGGAVPGRSMDIQILRSLTEGDRRAFELMNISVYLTPPLYDVQGLESVLGK